MRHNPQNAVTQSFELVEFEDGRLRVCKVLGHYDPTAPAHCATALHPSDWNWWRREAEVYRSERLRASLRGTGLSLAPAEVLETSGRVELRIDHVDGQPAPSSALMIIATLRPPSGDGRPDQTRRVVELGPFSCGRTWDRSLSSGTSWG